MITLPTINLGKALESALASGHPWIYRNHLPARPKLRHAEWVRLEAGRVSAIGLFDAESPIAVRIFANNQVPDRAFLRQRVDEALQLRNKIRRDGDTSAYRLLSGEGDYLPGITVDLYDRFAVLESYASSVDSLVLEVARAVARELPLKGIVQRRNNNLDAVWGELPPPEVTVTENGIKLFADLWQGQKTGLFLDHRDNRATLERYCSGVSLLDVFGYTGAYALYCLRGGAANVTSIDSARPAIDAAKRNFALNGYDPDRHDFIVGDAFQELEGLQAQQRRFGIVLLDPPSFARHRGQRHRAQRAYRRLNALALELVEPGGLLATASCTAQVSPEAFLATLDAASQDARVRLQIIHQAGHAADHPIPSSFPEGRYLKFVIARVLPL